MKIMDDFSSPGAVAVWIGGVLVLVLFGLTKFFGSAWLKKFEEDLYDARLDSVKSIEKFDKRSKELFDLLTSIKDQLSKMETQVQIQSAYIHEVEIRVDSRLTNFDVRLDGKSSLIAKNTERITNIEQQVAIIKSMHKKNHPSDGL